MPCGQRTETTRKFLDNSILIALAREKFRPRRVLDWEELARDVVWLKDNF